MTHRELLTTAITVRRKIRRGLGISEIEGITELLGREFCAMVKGRHTSQPGTSSLAMEDSAVSLRRQGSDYLSEQVAVLVLSLGAKFATYSTKLSKVVSRVKGRKVTTEHGEEVGARDKAQVVIVISRNHRVMEGQAREFHRERSQSFAGSSRGQRGGKESIKEVLEESILERGKEGFAIFNNMLEILPFHLKRLLQSSIGSLRIPLGSLGKLMNTQQPMVYFGEEPRVKLGRFSNKAPKIAVTSTYGNSKSGEECLSS